MSFLPSRDPRDYTRVLSYATKPGMNELKLVSAVSGAGLLLIGTIGFLIFALMSLVPM